MHAVVNKIMEQSEAFVKTYMSEKKLLPPTYVTCSLLRRADIAQKKDWKIVTDSGTTWRSYQNEVKDFITNPIYLIDMSLRIHLDYLHIRNLFLVKIDQHYNLSFL